MGAMTGLPEERVERLLLQVINRKGLKISRVGQLAESKRLRMLHVCYLWFEILIKMLGLQFRKEVNK